MGSTMPFIRLSQRHSHGGATARSCRLCAHAVDGRRQYRRPARAADRRGRWPPGSQQEFLVSVGDRVFFETNSSVLTSDAQATLDKQAQWLQQYRQYRIVIEGHADERGTREYNIALGARRGTAVVNYLVSRGIPANRISSVSYGKERPVAICNDISCWSQNRRAVTVLTN